jgi:hypothetical protein
MNETRSETSQEFGGIKDVGLVGVSLGSIAAADHAPEGSTERYILIGVSAISFMLMAARMLRED